MARTHAVVQGSTAPVTTHATAVPTRPAVSAFEPPDTASAPERPIAGHHFADVSFVEPAAASVQRQPDPPPSGNPDDARRMMEGGYSGFILRNLLMQRYGGTPDPSTRLAALRGTAHFNPGTVGHGAHWGITQIYSMLGGIGQSTIGSLFGSPQAQSMMAQPIASPANRGLANMEHGYWLQRLMRPGSAGELFGGILGSIFNPGARAGLQGLGGVARTVAPRAAMHAGPVGVAGALGLHALWPYLQRLRQNE